LPAERRWSRSASLLGQVDLSAPVGLQEDTVDLFEVDGFGAVAFGFEQGAQTEVSGAPDDAFGRADDEAERGIRSTDPVLERRGG